MYKNKAEMIELFLALSPARVERSAAHSLQQPRGAQLPSRSRVPEAQHAVGAACDKPGPIGVRGEGPAAARMPLPGVGCAG